MRTTHLIAALAGLAVVAVACGEEASSTPVPAVTNTVTTETMTDKTMTDDTMTTDTMTTDTMTADVMTDDPMTETTMTDDTMTTDVMTDDPMTETTATDALMLAPWQELALTDVDGNEFTIGDFVGTPVFVENFATWCPKCRDQLGDTNTAAAELGEQAIFLALSVETDLSSQDVADYARDNGFDSIRFAVMTPDFLAAISEAFGNSSINPPSTPHFVIDPNGVSGELVTGSVSSAAIVEALLAAAM